MHAAVHSITALQGNIADSAPWLREYRLPGGIDSEACIAFHGLKIRWDEAMDVGFADPMPSEPELAAFYTCAYRRVMGKAVGSEAYERSPNYVAQARSLVGWLEPLLQMQGRWLDVGAAFGLLLREVARTVPRWELYAVEPSEEARPYLEPRATLETDFAAFWSGATGRRDYFDVVSIVHVLEHLRDPGAALDELYARLKPGGFLLVEVPNDGRAEVERPDRRSDLPHLWFFSEAGLRNLARAHGFEVIRSAQLGLRRTGQHAPLPKRVLRTARRVLGGRMSLLEDPDWYREAPGRSDLRLLCRKP